MKPKYLDSKYWQQLDSKSPMSGITLDESVSLSDSIIYGNRLADRQIKMFESFGDTALKESRILDVGCGIGRISKPFSKRFKTVVGVDINTKILEAAREFIGDTRNIELIQNDGNSIPFEKNTFEYIYSGGVLQHIPDIAVITNYFYEGLRVLKPNGILNYSIQVWMVLRKGGIHGDRIGAQITAADIEAILNKTGHELLTIYFDEKDPLPHFNIIIRKLDLGLAQVNIQNRKSAPYSIKQDIVEKMNVRTGIFEDLESYTNHRLAWAKTSRRKITFFKQPVYYGLWKRLVHLLKTIIKMRT